MPIDPPETVYVTEKTVACAGGEGALGHPMVYLNMGEDGRIDCPYCDREFILEGGPADITANQLSARV